MGLKKKIILGVLTHTEPKDEAIRLLDLAVGAGVRTKVCFLNAHATVLAVKDKDFHAALQDFLVLNDGVGIDIACWLKYGKFYPDNLNGTDFIPLYLAQTTHAFRIFLLGARAEVVEKTAQNLTQTFPQHQVVGFCDGYEPRDEALLERIRGVKPDLILVALGNPMQEFWVAEHFEKTGAMLAMTVGALFDFIAGRVPRAPYLVRKLRSEWLFRLLCESRRLYYRYTVENACFLFYAVCDAVKYRLGSSARH